MTIGFIFFITNSTPIGVHPSQIFSVWPISDLVGLPAVVANPFRPAVAARAAVGVAAVDVMSSPLPLSSRARLLSLGAPTCAQSLHSIKDDLRCKSVSETLHRHRGPVLEQVGACLCVLACAFRHIHVVGFRGNIGFASMYDVSMQ